MNDADLVGAYILTCLSLRRPARYLSCPLKRRVVTDETALRAVSVPIGCFSGLLELLGADFIGRKCELKAGELAAELPVAVVFNRSLSLPYPPLSLPLQRVFFVLLLFLFFSLFFPRFYF